MNRLLAAVLVCGVAGGAYAGDGTVDHTGWYVGGDVGPLALSIDNDNGSSFEKDTSAGIGVFGGYNITELFGVELSLATSGDSNDQFDSGYASLMLTPKLTLQLVDKFSLFAKAGLVVASYVIDPDGAPSSADESIDWSGVGATVGLGANLSITNHLNARVTYDYTKTDMEPVDDIYFDGTTFWAIKDIEVISNRLSLGVYYQF